MRNEIEVTETWGTTGARNPDKLLQRVSAMNYLFCPVLAACLAVSQVLACGPNFPNTLLNHGDRAVLGAPAARFHDEIMRMKLVPPRHAPNFATNGYSEQAAEADIADLRASLRKAKVTTKQKDATVKLLQTARASLLKIHPGETEDADEAKPKAGEVAKKADASEKIEVPDGLPGEFADYLRGSIAWHFRDAGAEVAWKKLLERPAAERQFKSTWAAFMLGKLNLKDKPEKAIEYFQQVRTLAQAGFADSLGLAASSIGWEAKAELDQKHFLRAIELYLEQAAGGDDSAIVSLQWTVGRAFEAGGPVTTSLAAHPQARRVVTAFLNSHHGDWGSSIEDDAGPPKARQWLAAVEAANVKDVEAAEQLALTAYRTGDFDGAIRWIKRSGSTPVTQWLQAKLLLRDGKVNEAATLLARVVKAVPLEPRATNAATKAKFIDNLHVHSGDSSVITSGRQALGELGVLRLARREYIEALDALLRSGFWMDAAYVAERVLTADELKTYVDRNWPAPKPAPPLKVTGDSEHPPDPGSVVAQTPLDQQRELIRHLLGRRLTRLSRGNEAGSYFPERLKPQIEKLLLHLRAGHDASLPAPQRGTNLFAAARLARFWGLGLLATELQPDWAIHDGQYAEGVTWQSRDPNPPAPETTSPADENHSDGVGQTNPPPVLVASVDEIRRARAHASDPDTRYHYRALAADLALAAAKLMPDNDDDTARMLCAGGIWSSSLDHQTGQYFYKVLMSRCRKTELGKVANEKRWFPKLDKNGYLVPNQLTPPIPKTEPVPGGAPPEPPAGGQ